MATSCDAVIALTLLLLHILYSDCTKCKKDEALSDSYPINIYYCEDPKLPECCQIEHKPTCCETKSQKSVKNQFELWGILGIVVVAVAFVVVCWRKDTYMCEGDTLRERCRNCCNCKKKKSVDDDESAIELTVSKRSGKDKYNERAKTPVSHREGTTITSRGVEPMFTSQQELHMSDVDSGRGSVTSSTPPSNEMSPHTSKNSNSDNFTAINYGPSSSASKTGRGELADTEEPAENNTSKSSKKKSKAKKKKKKSKKSKQKINHEDSDSDVNEVNV